MSQTFCLEDVRWPWETQGDVLQALGDVGLGLIRGMLARGVGLDVSDASSWLDRERVRTVRRDKGAPSEGPWDQSFHAGQKEEEGLSQMEEEERVRKPGRKAESGGLQRCQEE